MVGNKSRWRRSISGGRRKPRARAVSDVIATILLLALTVTLFAAIFAFVTTFPSPPAQNNNQFQASVTLTSNLTYVSSLHILHLAGPAVSGTSLVYLKSAVQPSAPEFASPYTVSSGLGGATQWNLGQTWTVTFTSPNIPLASSNITVYVTSGSALIFSVILPGTSLAPAPTIVATAISPSPPTVGQSFTVYATIAGSYAGNSVYVNLAAVPGGPTTAQKMSLNSQGEWTYTLSTGASTNGTFYGFVNATSSSGLTATGSVVITVVTGSSGGGPILTVGVVLVPAPPNSGTAESVQAVVTYTGTLSSQALSVSFAGSSTPTGYTFSGNGPTGLTISGPSSVTVASQTLWTIPNPNSVYAFSVSATATVGTLTPVTGTTSFTPANVALSATSGLIGTSLTATGGAWSTASGSTVTLTFGGAAVTVTACTTGTVASSVITPSSSGAFVCTLTVPNGAPAGATSLVATDAFSGQTDSEAFTVTAWTLAVGPSPGLMGSTATARGAGYAASSSVTLAFSGVTITPSGTTNSTCTFSGSTITTTSTGTFVCRFTIPNGARAGVVPAYANDTTYSAQVGSTTYTVTAWTLSVGPASGLQGSTATARGAGFAGSSSVTLTFQGVTITPSGTTNATCTFTGSTITATSTGTFVCQFAIPTVLGGGVAGSATSVATDSTYSSQVATSTTTVTSWSVTLSPTTLSHSTSQKVYINGTGFEASSLLAISLNGTLLVSGTLSFACTTGTLSGSTITLTTGAFACSITLGKAGGAAIYTFIANDYTSGQSATAYLSRT